jgi:hypothetical protein
MILEIQSVVPNGNDLYNQIDDSYTYSKMTLDGLKESRQTEKRGGFL